MKIAYFDCPSGISGNMILGALLDSGLDIAYFKKAIGSLRLNPDPIGTASNRSRVSEHFKLLITKIKKHGISGTHVEVRLEKEKTSRNLKDILGIINKSRLSKQVKFLSSRIFKRLAGAEAKVHGVPVNKVHFHEVGAIDAIIDIVGACVGIEKLGIDRIYCSPLPSGKGKIVHSHGLLPNPSPAAAELMKGVPVFGTGIKGELVTPTGAAIITTLADSFGDLPRMKAESVGCGAGTINLPIPNLLRVFIGEAQIPAERDAVLQIETNIDDMDPKRFPKAIARLMKAGALDAYITPILMKKGRKAFNLTVLSLPEKRDRVLEELFTQTTTFGARVYLVPREKLSRKFVKVGTKLGNLRVKLGFLGGKLMTASPEYKSVLRLVKGGFKDRFLLRF